MSQVTGECRLSDFFAVLSEDLNALTPRTEETRYARDRQVQRMRKRAAFVRPHLHDEAVRRFVATNIQVRGSRVTLDPQLVRDARHFITVVLERFNTAVDPECIQEPLIWSYLFDNWRFGPGSSNGIRGTHAAQKVTQDMTCTVLAMPLIHHLRRSNPYFALYDEQRRSSGVVQVSGSRLTTVPKNEDTERTIAIEPLGNMALQLAAGRYLEDVLRYIGLDIRDQQKYNKLLAHRGSIDGSLATIDLKSASDMISIDLVRALMPVGWFDLLLRLRSPEIELPDGTALRLHMISTMGNGFTFPLMTLLLTALIYGFRAQRGGPNLRIDWNSTAVFGDDIIVPTHEYDDFCEVLHRAGLVVNHDKSFRDGWFRESCGGDYYKGYDVTPFYVRALDTDAHVYTAINQVFEWSARHNLLLHRSLIFLRSCLRGKPLLVPEWCNPDSGVRTAQCPRRYAHLEPRVEKERLRNHFFAMMLACGGFVVGSGPHIEFAPRQFKTRMRVRRSRLPRGYLDGSDPLSRSAQVTTYIGGLAPLLFGDEPISM